MLQYQKVQSNAGKSYKVLLIYFTSSISQFRKYEIIIMERYFTANPSFYENVARLTLFIYEIASSYLNCLHLMNMDWDSSHDVMRPMSLFGSNTDQQVNNILTMSEWFWCNSFSPLPLEPPVSEWIFQLNQLIQICEWRALILFTVSNSFYQNNINWQPFDWAFSWHATMNYESCCKRFNWILPAFLKLKHQCRTSEAVRMETETRFNSNYILCSNFSLQFSMKALNRVISMLKIVFLLINNINIRLKILLVIKCWTILVVNNIWDWIQEINAPTNFKLITILLSYNLNMNIMVDRPTASKHIYQS